MKVKKKSKSERMLPLKRQTKMQVSTSQPVGRSRRTRLEVAVTATARKKTVESFSYLKTTKLQMTVK